MKSSRKVCPCSRRLADGRCPSCDGPLARPGVRGRGLPQRERQKIEAAERSFGNASRGAREPMTPARLASHLRQVERVRRGRGQSQPLYRSNNSGQLQSSGAAGSPSAHLASMMKDSASERLNSAHGGSECDTPASSTRSSYQPAQNGQ